MASSTEHVTRPQAEDGTGTPKHLIIWLDQYIGQPDEYLFMERAFFMTADPTTGYPVYLTQEDIDRSIRLDVAIPVQLAGVQFMLRAFDKVENCFEAIENNLDKRLFFITSGTKGGIIVPALVARFPDTFTVTTPLYIFCGNMNMVQVGDVAPAHDWALEYTNHLLMMNHEQDLLERVVLDIAEYFFVEGGRLNQAGELDDARQHYHWAKIMLGRYEEMVGNPVRESRRAEIERRLAVLEQERANRPGDRVGEPPV